MRFRIGINIGDAIPHGTDLHGDAVNVAARLEAASPAGGICVSRSVLDHVHERLSLSFEPIGQLVLKNISRPVEAFVLHLDRTAEEQASETKPSHIVQPHVAGAQSRLRPVMIAAYTILLASVTAGAGWWFINGSSVVRQATDVQPAPQVSQTLPPAASATTSSDIGLANAPRLSVVVLPFNNLGGDVDNDAVDGITEDLTTDLSRVAGFLVIARNSAFTYKGKAIDVKFVGEELGVRYAVKGSVRTVEGTLRVNVQLISTETGTHLWAERFDVRRDGIGYGVDDIVRQIAFTLNVRIIDTEATRSLRERPNNPDVADILLRARSVYNRPVTPQRQTELVSLYKRAIELDPTSAFALAGLAEATLDDLGSWDSPSTPETLRHAEELLVRAELLRPDDLMVMWTRVYLSGLQNRCPELMAAAQKAVTAYPTTTGPRHWQAICLTRMGRPAEAIPYIEQAIRVSPRNPNMAARYRTMAYSLLTLGRYDEAVDWFRRSLAENPREHARTLSSTYANLAAAQALAGHPEEARLSAAEATRLVPTLTARSFFSFTVRNQAAIAQVARVRDGMRLAGIRDHADEDADFNLEPDRVLHTNYEAHTPTTAPGTRTIRTPELVKLLEQRKPIVLDTINWGQSLPGAIGLWGAGIGGSFSDEFQERLGRKMQQLTGGDRDDPIISVGFNSDRYQGRNLALRLVALGYTEVYWYRGGREAWQAAGLPDADLVLQDW
jgi:TolB-like protein/tetratricopeptide (TPR) repeat protein